MIRTHFHNLLDKRVKELVESRSASLARGAAADYAEYKYTVGYLSGLEDALKICDEIEGEADERSSAS